MIPKYFEIENGNYALTGDEESGDIIRHNEEERNAALGLLAMRYDQNGYEFMVLPNNIPNSRILPLCKTSSHSEKSDNGNKNEIYSGISESAEIPNPRLNLLNELDNPELDI